MPVEIPELSLVLLIGASGSGKSTFAQKHFKQTEILSSDYCRALISDDENDQTVTKEAFDILHFIASKRLAAGKLTVIDATNVQIKARQPLLALARKHHVLPVAIVFNVPEKLCYQRNQQRTDRHLEPEVIRQQRADLKQSLHPIKLEGFKPQYMTIFESAEAVESTEIKRTPLPNNLKHETGPFDVIGDVHGCFEELVELLEKLGYVIHTFDRHNPSPSWKVSGKTLFESGFQAVSEQPTFTVSHPEDRKVIFLGDLVDRGPKIPEVLRLVMDMVAAGIALCVPGNHDVKLMRKLKGKNVQLTHGLADSVQQLETAPAEFHQQALQFIDSLVSHYLLDNGKLVVAHAGISEQLQGRTSGKVREFALYGQTTGETDEFGFPVRYNWAADYRGAAMVVYGHTLVPEAQWLNNTICIDTGCVFGGKLTALRYPEKQLVSVPAKQTYYESIKPFLPTISTKS